MCRRGFAIALLTLAIQSPVRAAMITLNYAANVPLAFQPVIDQARDNWITALGGPLVNNNINLTVNVEYGLMPPGLQEPCGVGAVTQSNGAAPTQGTIRFNSAANNWFVDPTPAHHEEYMPVPNEPWRGTPIPQGPAAGKVDLLSCAKHELGHTLGFTYDSAPTGQFGPYKALIAGGTITMRQADFPNHNPVPSIAAGQGANDNDKSHFWPNNNMIASPDNANVNIPIADLMMVPDPPVFGGSDRKVMSPYDVGAVAVILGLPQNSYNLRPKDRVPEPSTLALFVTGLLLARRRVHRKP
jgi:hypothetical protein